MDYFDDVEKEFAEVLNGFQWVEAVRKLMIRF
jgi:hypothetical protein